MHSPFPGMDPYLEHPSLWPDVHNSLLAAMRDALAPLVAPRYYIGLERRAYLLHLDDLIFVGRPDLSVIARQPPSKPASRLPLAGTNVIEVEVPVKSEVSENYLTVHEVTSGELVTLVELLSPANKLHEEGRKQYLEKRQQILNSYTSLVEIDLLRAGEPMPVVGTRQPSDYNILVSRGWKRPRSLLYFFNLREAIPVFPLPLRKDEEEPPVKLGEILHALYERARFDLRLDYSRPPVPPLSEEDAAWANELSPR